MAITTVSQVPDLRKLLFWLKNRYNVLFEGKHGIGKTARVLEAFKEAGLRYAYFSGSTMDPFVDFVGVPLKVEGPEGPSIELIRPEHIVNANLQAIFFDEFNRTHRKIRNAVMELIQFKTINSKPISKDLQVIWAAVNPDSEDGDGIYDTDRLDPAQRDRFHIQISLPYTCDMSYFSKKFGVSMAKAAIQFWDELPQQEKDKLSPRRLDYALEVFKAEGDVRDVIPASCNPAKLSSILGIGPADEKLRALVGKPELARAFLSNENNFSYSLKTILGSREYVSEFVPQMPAEKIAALYETDGNIRTAAHRDIKVRKHASPFYPVLKEIAVAGQNAKVAAGIRNRLAQMGAPIGMDAIQTFGEASLDKKAIDDLREKADKPGSITGRDRRRIYDKLEKISPKAPDREAALSILSICNSLCHGSKKIVDRDMLKLIPIVNAMIVCLLGEMKSREIEDHIDKNFHRLNRYRRSVYAPTAQVIETSNKAPAVAAATAKERTSKEIMDEKEMKLIYDAYSKNGGSYSSYEKIEMDPKFGLKYAKGMNAYRICKRYGELRAAAQSRKP